MYVINLYGEPSAGKTATMLALAAELKRMGLNVDIGNEYYKELVYQSTPAGEEDNLEEITKRTLSLVEKLGGQYTIFSNQWSRLKRLEGTVDFAVTDCPLPLIGYYSQGMKEDCFLETIKSAHNKFNNLDYIIKRTHNFETRARVHSETQAEKVASELPNFLSEFCPNSNFTKVDSGPAIESVIVADLIKKKIINRELLNKASLEFMEYKLNFVNNQNKSGKLGM